MTNITVEQIRTMKEIDNIFVSLIELRRMRWGRGEIRELTKRLLRKVLEEYNRDHENEVNHEIELNDNGFPIFKESEEK